MKIGTFLYSYLATLHRDTKGASAIEYAVIAGLIVVALITVLGLLGGGIADTFQGIVNALPGLGGGGGGDDG